MISIVDQTKSQGWSARWEGKCNVSRWAHSHCSRSPRAAPPVLADSYPTKPVKIITQAPAGAGPDVILRIVASGLTQMWGQQVLVINRPGGGGLIAAQAAATTSERDGHTLYMASASAVVVLPETQAKLPFSFDRDFVSIGLVGEQPFVIASSSCAENQHARGVHCLGEATTWRNILCCQLHRHAAASDRRVFPASQRHRRDLRAVYRRARRQP